MMIFKNPKTKTGKSLDNVTVTYKINNISARRWFVNDKLILLNDLSVLLGYESRNRLMSYLRRYGIVKVMKYGSDALRDGLVEPKQEKVTKHGQSPS